MPMTPFLVILYVAFSSSMLVINKSALLEFSYPVLLSAIQTLSSALFIWLGRYNGIIDFFSITLSNIWHWRVITLAFVTPLVLNMKAVESMPVESVMVFRAVSTVFVGLCDYVFLHVTITPLQRMACCVISFGGCVYALNDNQYSLTGYIWGSLYAASIVFNTIYIKYSFDKLPEMSSWEKSFYNNLLSSIILLVVSFIFEDHTKTIETIRHMSLFGHAAIVTSCIVGLGMTISHKNIKNRICTAF